MLMAVGNHRTVFHLKSKIKAALSGQNLEARLLGRGSA